MAKEKGGDAWAELLRTNPKVAESIALVVPQEMDKLFGEDEAAMIAEARANVTRLSDLASGAPKTGAGHMDRDQQAEWLRCALSRMNGFHTDPKADLDAEGVITQALTPIVDSAGGYTSPDDFWGEVEKKAEEPAVVWPLLTKRATKRRTVKKAEVTSYVTVNKGAAANVNAATTATEITETVPIFDEMQWDLEDFDARMPIKLDLLEESAVDIYQELIDLCADGYAIEREREPIVGTGHAFLRPLGLLDAAAGITTVPVGAAPTLAKILDFCSEIPQRYRSRAKLLMGGDTLFATVAQLAENVRAAEFLVGKIPEMLESAYVTEGKILGGDFSRYVVYQIRMFQIISSIAAERKTREVVVTECWTGRPTQTDAFRIATSVTYD